MKAKKKISLKWKFFAAFAGFLCILLGLLWLCQTVFLNTFYKAVKVYETKQTAAEMVRILSEDDAEMRTAALSNEHDVSIRVFDADFECIYAASGRMQGNLFNNIPDSEMEFFAEKAADNGGTYAEYFEGFQKMRSKKGGNQNDFQTAAAPTSYIIAKTVTGENGEIFTVIVNAAITPVDSVITTLRVILIVVTAITVAAALFAALILSAGLTKPLKNISSKAKVLATGDYHVEFESSTVREIDELSDSLNFAKSELGKIDALQKELVANISHDLRTPLTLISGYAEVMRDIPGEINDENLQVIIDESKRLTSLVSDVLDLSKFSSSVEQLNPERMDLVECIESLIPRYNKLVEKDDYKIIFESGTITRAPIHADRTRLLQVIYNLINNAVSYTGADKTVRIRLLEDTDTYTVHIIDSGEGIPEDKLPYIWERYYKVDKNHRRAQMGSGLGLSIVKQILDAHGASYGVSSQLGKGSDFWFAMKKES